MMDLDGTYKKEEVHTALSAETYVKNVVEKYENLLKRDFHTRYSVPFDPDYHPELIIHLCSPLVRPQSIGDLLVLQIGSLLLGGLISTMQPIPCLDLGWHHIRDTSRQ